MNDPLLALLRANPKCRVTITSSKPRKRARDGDVKWKRGQRWVRRQVTTRDGRLVRRGNPVLEWRQEDIPEPHDSDFSPRRDPELGGKGWGLHYWQIHEEGAQ